MNQLLTSIYTFIDINFSPGLTILCQGLLLRIYTYIYAFGLKAALTGTQSYIHIYTNTHTQSISLWLLGGVDVRGCHFFLSLPGRWTLSISHCFPTSSLDTCCQATCTLQEAHMRSSMHFIVCFMNIKRGAHEHWIPISVPWVVTPMLVMSEITTMTTFTYNQNVTGWLLSHSVFQTRNTCHHIGHD